MTSDDVLAGCRPSGSCDQCRLETSRYRAYPPPSPPPLTPPAMLRRRSLTPRPQPLRDPAAAADETDARKGGRTA